VPPYLHVAAAISALVLGTVVVSTRKGTPRHRVMGSCYVIAILLTNIVALTVTRSTGGFGPFHVLALVSLCTVAAGIVPMWLFPRSAAVIAAHGITMGFSYVGLIAAGLSQAVAHLIPAQSGAGVVATSVVTFAAGAALIFRLIPRALSGAEAKGRDPA
jgi:uncharacterized membrane protein